MRIIGGEFRSRLIRSLPGLDVRPTPDRLREALFNILAPRIAGATFIDAYAGTGAVGLEALSRGASRTVFLENDRAACEVIRANLKSLGIENRAEVRMGRVTGSLEKVGGDIVFLDPPYPLDREYAAVLGIAAKDPPPLVIVQHDARRRLDAKYGRLESVRVLRQGDNVLTFFAPAE
jgi:16S rRNA (guanine(966)-N(2))-methyltransferase RsmD